VERNSFAKLDSKFLLHGILARMTAKDGISFWTFRASADLRDALKSLLRQKGQTQELPKSEMTIKKYVMSYGQEAQTIVKEVSLFRTEYIHLISHYILHSIHSIVNFVAQIYRT
jgi:hypothetical protein